MMMIKFSVSVWFIFSTWDWKEGGDKCKTIENKLSPFIYSHTLGHIEEVYESEERCKLGLFVKLVQKLPLTEFR